MYIVGCIYFSRGEVIIYSQYHIYPVEAFHPIIEEQFWDFFLIWSWLVAFLLMCLAWPCTCNISITLLDRPTHLPHIHLILFYASILIFLPPYGILWFLQYILTHWFSILPADVYKYEDSNFSFICKSKLFINFAFVQHF